MSLMLIRMDSVCHPSPIHLILVWLVHSRLCRRKVIFIHVIHEYVFRAGLFIQPWLPFVLCFSRMPWQRIHLYNWGSFMAFLYHILSTTTYVFNAFIGRWICVAVARAEAPVLLHFDVQQLFFYRPIDVADWDRENRGQCHSEKDVWAGPGCEWVDASFKNECIRHIQLNLK